MIIPWSLRR